MKKLIVSFFLIIASNFVFAQLQHLPCNCHQPNNVRLYPQTNSLCPGDSLYLWIAGNSFNPVLFNWSTGETTPSITITTSGTYSLTVSGYQGAASPNNWRTYCFTKNYCLPAKPIVTPITETTVCRGTDVSFTSSYSGVPGATVRWLSTLGRDTIGSVFTEHMYHTDPNGARPDTMHVWCEVTLPSGCVMTSDWVYSRSIRLTDGVVEPHQRIYPDFKRYAITDSARNDFALSCYLDPTPIHYIVTFTDTLTGEVFADTTEPDARRVALNMLTPWHVYWVETTPVMDNQLFCSGERFLIKITAPVTTSAPRFGEDPMPSENSGTEFKIFPNPATDKITVQTELKGTVEIFDASGRLMFSKEKLEHKEVVNIADYKPGLYVVVMDGARQKFIKQ